MSQSPQSKTGSRSYQEAWRAINILIRSDGSWSGRERDVCYRNRGDGTFEDVSFVSGLDLDADGRTFVPFDFDSDGDSDLILGNRSGRQLRAFRNDSPAAGARGVALGLEGRQSNRDGVGARVRLRTDRGAYLREIVSGSGFLSQRARRAEFGLDAAESVQAIEVRWPSGRVERFSDVPPGRALRAVEGSGRLQVQAPQKAKPLASEPAREYANPAGTWLAEPVPAPSFSLESLAGGAVASSRFAGSKTLINFWASWCPPCRHELADLSAQYDRFRAGGLEIVAISVDKPEERAAAEAFARETRLPFAVLFADDATVNAYTILNERLFDRRRELAIPTSFLLNEQGEVLKVYRGPAEATQILADAAGGAHSAEPFAGRWVVSGPKRDFGELAAAFAERGLNSAALEMFAQGAQTAEQPAGFYNNYAGALIAAGDLQQADALLRKSLELDPLRAETRVNLGRLSLERGDARQAETLIRAALEDFPEDVEALGLLAASLFAQQRIADAEQVYRQASALAPDDPQTHENLGALLASSGRAAEAIDEYQRAADLGAHSVKLHSNLGVLYMQAGMPANARLSFGRAVDADPSDYGAQVNLAQYFLVAGDGRQALEWAAKAAELDPDRPEARLIEAQAQARLGAVDEARRILEGLLQRDPALDAAKSLLEQL